MHSAASFLEALTIVLGVAAVTTLVFQRLRQPVVLGYLLAGLIIGPHTSIPLVAEPEVVHTLSELGVILLMFSLGLEFRLRTLLRVAPTAGLTAVFQCSVMMWAGFLAGRALGWTTMESVFAGAIVAVSSTTIIAKAFDEQRIEGPLRELVVAILIVEDLVAVLLMAILTAVASGAGLSAGDLGTVVVRLGGFLIGTVAIGILVVPRLVRAALRVDRAETIVIAAVGICFAISLLAAELGYSVALGAFIAGTLVAEAGDTPRIERLLEPLRDVFAAIFFVAVGMMIDPELIAEHAVAVLVFTAVVVVGKVVSVTLGAFFTGSGVRTSVAAGMSLAQIGEFSFIIAGLGLTLGVTGHFLYPVAVAVSAITTLITPWLIRGSGAAARLVDHKLPRRLQTFVALYGSWLDRLRRSPRRPTAGAFIRRRVALMAIDMAIVAGLVIGVAVNLDRIVASVADAFELDAEAARIAVIAATVAVALPFCLGIARLADRLARLLAELALPARPAGEPDLGQAPRTALGTTLRIAGIVAAALPIVALTQPFLPRAAAAIVLGVGLAALGVAFWRTTRDLQGHVRAGAQIIVEALAGQVAPRPGAAAAPVELEQVRALLPGLGEPVSIDIAADSPAVGRSLAQLDVRGATGAIVLAITRAEGSIPLPTAGEVLRAGDRIALAGSEAAIAAALRLLAD
jgi:CPA2 family monovalent cation:H+ antiporter-2